LWHVPEELIGVGKVRSSGLIGQSLGVLESTRLTPSGHCPADALLAQLPTTWLYGEGRGKLSQTYPGVQPWPRIA